MAGIGKDLQAKIDSLRDELHRKADLLWAEYWRQVAMLTQPSIEEGIKVDKEIERTMQCPYCSFIFTISEEQQQNNQTFRCPRCKRHNQGSVRAENDVLRGE